MKEGGTRWKRTPKRRPPERPPQLRSGAREPRPTRKKRTAAAKQKPRSGGQHDLIVWLVSRNGGASLSEIMKARLAGPLGSRFLKHPRKNDEGRIRTGGRGADLPRTRKLNRPGAYILRPFLRLAATWDIPSVDLLGLERVSWLEPSPNEQLPRPRPPSKKMA